MPRNMTKPEAERKQRHKPWVRIADIEKQQGKQQNTLQESGGQQRQPKIKMPVPPPKVVASYLAKYERDEAEKSETPGTQENDDAMSDGQGEQEAKTSADLDKLKAARAALEGSGEDALIRNLDRRINKGQAAAKNTSDAGGLTARKRYGIAAQYAFDCNARAEAAEREATKARERLKELEDAHCQRRAEADKASKIKLAVLEELNAEEGGSARTQSEQEQASPGGGSQPQQPAANMREACSEFIALMQKPDATQQEAVAERLQALLAIARTVVVQHEEAEPPEKRHRAAASTETAGRRAERSRSPVREGQGNSL